MGKFKNENWIWILPLIILAIIFLKPAGLFSVVNVTEEYPCPPGWTLEETPKPCEGAVWIDTPKCTWDISGCEDYCESDDDCKIPIPAPNDCSLFWKPYNLTQIGYCQYNFCRWQYFPDAGKSCSAFELFIQKFKWVLAGIFIIFVAFFIFEKDFGGKKRGWL